MPGFGTLAPGDDWEDQEALASLALQQEDARKAAAKPQGIMDIAAGPGRIISNLAKTPTAPVDEATQQYFPETYENPVVKGLVGGLGSAIASGVTAPGDALAGKIPIHDEDGHISPEMVRRGFDTAALAGGGGAAGTLASDTAKSGAAIAAAEHAAPEFTSLRPERTPFGEGPDWEKLNGKQQWAIHDMWRDSAKRHDFDDASDYYHAIIKPEPKEYPELFSPKEGGSLFSDSEPGAAVSAASHASQPDWHAALSGDFKPITSYHGSPHDFERFDISKIGAGEGQQAYGHGLYFAENEEVARNYRDQLTHRGLVKDTPYINSLVKSGMSDDKIIQKLKARGHSDGSQMLADYKSAPKGNMYKVQINANPEHFLDWDKPLSEQPAAMKAFSAEFGKGASNFEGMKLGEALDQARRSRGGEALTSRLRESGAPGIKYLDQGSRGKGEGSRNYVVFDDKLINVIRKYGIAGVPAAGALGMLTMTNPEEKQ